jgi:hypothetical protein
MILREISKKDIDAIVSLHLSVMPNSINSLLGRRHLTEVYQVSISKKSYFGYVIYDSANNILAFAGASTSYRALSRSVREVFTFHKYILLLRLISGGRLLEILRALIGSTYLSVKEHDLYISSWCSVTSQEGALAGSIVFRKILDSCKTEKSVIVTEILSENRTLLNFYKKLEFVDVLSVFGITILKKTLV